MTSTPLVTSIRPLVSHHPRGFSGVFYFYTAGFLHAVSRAMDRLFPPITSSIFSPGVPSRYFVVGIRRTSPFAQLLGYSAQRHLFLELSLLVAIICNGPHGYFPMLPPITSVGGCFPIRKAPRIFDQDAHQPPRRAGGHSARDQLAKKVSSPRLELPLCSDPPVYQSTAFAK